MCRYVYGQRRSSNDYQIHWLPKTGILGKGTTVNIYKLPTLSSSCKNRSARVREWSCGCVGAWGCGARPGVRACMHASVCVCLSVFHFIQLRKQCMWPASSLLGETVPNHTSCRLAMVIHAVLYHLTCLLELRNKHQPPITEKGWTLITSADIDASNRTSTFLSFWWDLPSLLINQPPRKSEITKLETSPKLERPLVYECLLARTYCKVPYLYPLWITSAGKISSTLVL